MRVFRQGLVLATFLASASGFNLRSVVNEAFGGEAPVQVGVDATSGDVTPLSAKEQEASVGTFLKVEDAAREKLILVDDSKLVFGKDPNDPTLTNWADNNKAFGLRKHHPKTYDEVAALVRQKRAEGAKLRPMGVVHSWSNLLPDDNTDVVFLDNFKLITQSPNDYSIVTVQAGVLQSELADWADSPARGVGRFSYLYQVRAPPSLPFFLFLGLPSVPPYLPPRRAKDIDCTHSRALFFLIFVLFDMTVPSSLTPLSLPPSLPSLRPSSQNTLVQPITFVGACQTASHGSGFLPPTPDYIIAMTIIDGNGEIKYFDRSHPDLKVGREGGREGGLGFVVLILILTNPSLPPSVLLQR